MLQKVPECVQYTGTCTRYFAYCTARIIIVYHAHFNLLDPERIIGQALNLIPAPLEKRPKQSDLLNQVAAQIPAKWRDVGLQFEIDNSNLEAIYNKYLGNVNSCFAGVFDLWRKNRSHPYTWATIIKILRTRSVGENQLADELEQWVENNAYYSTSVVI